MLSFRFKQNGEVAVRQVEELGARIKDASTVLADFGEHMLNTSIPKTFEVGGRPEKWPKSEWAAGRNLQRESGRLMRSVQYRPTTRKLEVGTNLKYALQRHYGGELVPTKAKALAVPLPGVPRSMRRPRRWGDRLHYLPSKSGDPDTTGVLAVARGRGKKKSWRAVFVLRKKVTQPARPFMLFQDDDFAYVSRRMVEYVSTGRLG